MSLHDSDRLEAAIALAQGACANLSDEDKARMAQLMTVWASGYLEATCRSLLIEYTRRRADESVLKYVSGNINRFQNPKMDNILSLVRGFDEEVAGRIDAFSEGRIRESVNSIVGLRHQIAHGRSASISVGRITEHFENAKRLARKMRSLLV